VILAVALGALPAPIGWLAGASLALIVIGTIVTTVTTGPAVWASWIAVTVILAVWLASLSANLLSRPAA